MPIQQLLQVLFGNGLEHSPNRTQFDVVEMVDMEMDGKVIERPDSPYQRASRWSNVKQHKNKKPLGISCFFGHVGPIITLSLQASVQANIIASARNVMDALQFLFDLGLRHSTR